MDNADKGPQDVGNDYPSVKASADSERAANEAEFERVFNQVADKPMADASDYSNEGRNSVAPEPDSNYSHEGRNSAVQADYSNEGRAAAPSAPAAAPMTFGQKFAAERKAGNGAFEWQGKKYTTKLAGEVASKAAPKATPVQSAPVKSVAPQAAPVATQQTAQAAPEPFDPYRGRVAIAGGAAPAARALPSAKTVAAPAAVPANTRSTSLQAYPQPAKDGARSIYAGSVADTVPAAIKQAVKQISQPQSVSDAINPSRYGAQKS